MAVSVLCIPQECLEKDCGVVKLIDEQNKEIERLTEERKTANKHDLVYWFNAYKECNEDCEKYAIENAELQKQVGELKLELQGQFDKGVKAGCLMSKVGEQQAVKEILQKIMNIIKKSDGFLAEEVIRIMAKQKGVEVE